jgi:uncharacterized protein YndB with AHSA1/START domain
MSPFTKGRLEVRVQRTFDAAPERVYRAFIEAEALRRWKAPGDAKVVLAEVDARVGGGYRVHMEGADGTPYCLRGEFREMIPGERLVYTWHWETDPPESETLVTVTLRDVGGRTELTLVHSGFQEEQARSGHGSGWNSCMEKLERVV